MIDALTAYPFTTMELEKGFNCITLARPQIFFQFVTGMQADTEGVSIFEDYTQVAVQKNILFIGDVMNPIDWDSLFLKQCMAQLLDSFSDTEIFDFQNLYSQIWATIQQKIWVEDLPLGAPSDFDIKNFVGLVKPTLEIDEPLSLFEKIQSIIKITGALQEKRTLVTLHTTQYCQAEEIKLLHQALIDRELQLLNFECTDQHFGLEGIRSHYVDSDLVQFS